MTCQRGPTPGRRIGCRADFISVAAIRTRLGLFLLIGLGCMAVGCATPPLGPAFEPAPAPRDHRARIYLYRSDSPGSLASVQLRIDGLEVGRMRNHEYETLELATGGHRLQAGLRGFGLLAWGWNEHRVDLKSGETVYLEISVRLTARSAPATRELEIAGRQSGSVSENVFIIRRTPTEALSKLELMTRLFGSRATTD